MQAMLKLNTRQAAFVKALVDEAPISYTEAAKRAGYPESSAHMQGSRLMKNAKVLAAVQERRAEHDKKTLADREWKRRKLVAIVEAGLAEVYNEKTGITSPTNLNASVGALAELAKIDGEIIKKSEIKADVKTSRSKDELEEYLVSFGIDPQKILERDTRRMPITINSTATEGA